MQSVWAVNGCVHRAVCGFVASTSGETEGWRVARSPANLGPAGKAVNQATLFKNHRAGIHDAELGRQCCSMSPPATTALRWRTLST